MSTQDIANRLVMDCNTRLCFNPTFPAASNYFQKLNWIQPLLLQPPLPVQETPQVAQSQVRGSGGPSPLFHCLYFVIRFEWECLAMWVYENMRRLWSAFQTCHCPIVSIVELSPSSLLQHKYIFKKWFLSFHKIYVLSQKKGRTNMYFLIKISPHQCCTILWIIF